MKAKVKNNIIITIDKNRQKKYIRKKLNRYKNKYKQIKHQEKHT